jgi:TRAP-type transport system periplasmic protein
LPNLYGGGLDTSRRGIGKRRLRMRRTGKIMLFALGLILEMCVCSITGFAQEKTIRLRYAIFFPPNHKEAMVIDSWCKEVGKRTQGRVTVKLYPGATITSPALIYDSVAQGVIDAGYTALSLSPGKFPLTEMLDYPLGYPSAAVSARLANEYFKKFHPKEFDDVKVLYLDASTPGILHTRKPVNKLEDLKGMKLKTGASNTRFIQLLGGIPVAMPMGETYDAISKGVVDGFLGGYEALEGWKLAEVIKSSTENSSTAYAIGMIAVMNKAKWNRIKPEDQKVIEQINQEWVQKHIDAGTALDQSAKSLSTKRGNKIIKLTAEENARWTEKTKPLFDDYVKNMKSKGLPGEEALKFARDYIKAHSK